MTPAVAIHDATKTFGTHVAVRALRLEVPKGCIYGFIGPNGSGKTTTLRLIMRILLPDQGDVVVLGERSARAADDRVGYLPEERGLYKHMAVRDVLRFFAALKGSRGHGAIDAWLERLDLKSWAGQKVEALSKGMAQKVQFIAAVVARPRLVLLDEPFTGLDPVNRDELRQAVLDLKKDGATVLFSTHDMAVAEQLCDFICMIHEGRKVLDGTLAEIQGRYGSDTVHVELEPAQRLDDLPGVARVTDLGNRQELQLAAGADTQRLLAALLERGRVRCFELARPSLHDIFVRIAGPAREDGHA